MGAWGLREVTNPSERFLSCRRTDVSGSAVICTVEGTRPVLLEMQALVSERAYGTPRRTATGFDMRRLQMLLAVLGRRARIRIADRDIFVNAVAGARIDEPAADAGVVAALASAAQDRPVPSDVVLIGEVGLVGELRGVRRLEHRLVESSRLGFRRAIVPDDAASLAIDGIELIPVRGIPEMLGQLDQLA